MFYIVFGIHFVVYSNHNFELKFMRDHQISDRFHCVLWQYLCMDYKHGEIRLNAHLELVAVYRCTLLSENTGTVFSLITQQNRKYKVFLGADRFYK